MKQIEDYLENLVKKSEEITNKYPDQKNVTEEDKNQLIYITASIITIAFVLDAEEEIKPLLRAIRYEALAQKMEGII